MNIAKKGPINWDMLYELEYEIKEQNGAKARYILIDEIVRRFFSETKSLNVLDGGGNRYTSAMLKKIFQDPFIVSVNINGENNMADIAIAADLADHEKITLQSNVPKFDVIFLGEVFEHLVGPGYIMKNLEKFLKPGGHMIITTPNLANIYNRVLLLAGCSLYNYRPMGFILHDHISVVTIDQMLDLLKGELKMEVIAMRGFSYYERKIGFPPKSDDGRSGHRFRMMRRLMNSILPLSFREGIIYTARKPL